MKKTICALIAILLLFPSLGAAAEPFSSSYFRCDKDMVSIGDPSIVIVAKCGEPVEKRRELDFSQLYFEKWIYGPRDGFYYVLTLYNDVVQKIEVYPR